MGSQAPQRPPENSPPAHLRPISPPPIAIQHPLTITTELASAYRDVELFGVGFVRLLQSPNGIVVERLEPNRVTVRTP